MLLRLKTPHYHTQHHTHTESTLEQGAGKRQRRFGGPLELLVVNTHLKAVKTAEGEKARKGVGEARGYRALPFACWDCAV